MGSKVVGTVVADAAGNYKFQLPAGLKKGGAYTLVAHAHGMYGLADKVSTPVSFKAGPAPHVKTPKAEPKAHKPAAPARTVVRVKPAAPHAPKVHTASVSNGHLVDHAVQALILNGHPFKKKGH